MKTSTSGTKTAMIGVWRPTMAPSVAVDKPDTLARVMIGVAIAPNATGAVQATLPPGADFCYSSCALAPRLGMQGRR